MDRARASQLLRDEMDKYGLTDWSARLNPVNLDSRFQYMGLCSYADKAIILNAHHVDLHSEEDILNTIRHEVAHALVGPNHGHDSVWTAKAHEVGCFHVAPCSYLGLPVDVIDAIRSGATVEVVMKEETHVTRTPTYKVTRLQDKCPHCHKILEIKKEIVVPSGDDEKPDKKLQFLVCGHLITKNIPKATPFHKIVFDGDASCQHEWVKTICYKCGAKRPYQFQIEGMRFAEQAMASYNGVVIMDEMGLGKTIQSLGYLKYHPEAFPVLFAVKSGLRFQFGKEIMRVLGDDHYCQIVQSSKDYLIPNLKGYIVSLDMLTPKVRNMKGKQIQQGFDISKFTERGIKTIVIDECQQIKNPDATRTQQIRRVIKDCGAKVIGLSGTPWKNRGSEFFTILNIVAPSKFPSHQGFKDRWVSYYSQGKYTKEGGIKNPKAFKEYIKDVAIRRQRTEVDVELPLINRMKLYIQLEDLQAEEYDDATSDFVKWYNDKVIGGEEDNLFGPSDGGNILAKMSRMRHIVGLSKIPATKEFIEQFFEENEEQKLVVFAHHQDVQFLLHEWVKEKYGADMYVGKITADMSGQARFEVQETFNKSEKGIIIASALAAGEGLNLQTCSKCIMHERQWNPANEEQQEGRFIRIGSTAAKVDSTYVEAEDTIDTLFDGIVERKRLQFHDAMNKGEVPTWNQGDLMKELAEAIVARHRQKHSGKTFVSVPKHQVAI